MCKISVIITTYNRSNLLCKAINSVLEQTFKSYEIIVVDDNSTDNTEIVMQSYLKKYHNILRYEKNKNNLGLSGSRNIGIKLSKGQYVTFLDDDDVWFPKRLEYQYYDAKGKSWDYGAFYCGNAFYTKGNDVVESIPWMKGSIIKALFKGWTPPCSASFFTSECLKRCGGFDENIKSGVDHDIWFKIAEQKYLFDFTPHGLVLINPHHHTLDRITTNTNKRINGIKIFLNKWKIFIINNVGVKGYKNFYNRYLSREYYGMAYKMIFNDTDNYFKITRHLLFALYYYPFSKKILLTLATFILSGRKGYKFIKQITKVFKIHKNSLFKVKQGLGIPGLKNQYAK